jgi:hypothetical protein
MQAYRYEQFYKIAERLLYTNVEILNLSNIVAAFVLMHGTLDMVVV